MVVQSLAELARSVRGDLTKKAFAKASGLSEPTIYKLEHGKPVWPEMIERLANYAGQVTGLLIREAAKTKGAVHDRTLSRQSVRKPAHVRLPGQQTESREGEALPFPHDLVKSAICRIYDGLSDRGRVEAMTAMGEIAQRDRLRVAPPKAEGQ